MKHHLRLGKLIIVTMALASGSLAVNAAVTQAAHAAAHPATAMSAHAQPGPEPPNPC